MPLQATSGAASYDAFGGGVPVVPKYIEDYFSTWLTTGTGSGSQTITNGIDLAGKGGMVWWKTRNNAYNHYLFDTNRGATNWLVSNQTSAQETVSNSLTSFNSDGFTIGDQSRFNGNTFTDVAWTWAKAPKFFDVVTYTGDGNSNRAVAHNLGSVPGFMIVKVTSEANNWTCWHRSIPGKILELNTTAAQANDSGGGYFYSSPDATNIYLGSDWQVNKSGATYVAYLFAHNAGGFGLTGTDNVVSCGSFNYNTFPQTVELGYEPQWIMAKRSDGVGDWIMFDNMRGYTAFASGGSGRRLLANTSDAETANDGLYYGSATGFNLNLPANGNYIYIAIRRGPMKVPTTGTSVFTPVSTSGNVTSITSGFPVDFALGKEIKNSTSYGNYAIDRLRGGTVLLETNTIGAEYTSQTFKFDSNTQFLQSGGGLFYGPSIYWLMRRAPSFFDVAAVAFKAKY